MIKIGLTGNIASGKSEVEKIIADLGYIVYDLDKITHKLYEDKRTQEKLLTEFLTYDRKQIASIVFNDKNKLKKLEDIIHPQLKEFVLNIKSDKPVFISGAVIYESGFDKFFDKIIFVEANNKTRLERLIKRNNLTQVEAQKRINSQEQNNKYKADFVIENNTTLDELKQNTIKILNQILN